MAEIIHTNTKGVLGIYVKQRTFTCGCGAHVVTTSRTRIACEACAKKKKLRRSLEANKKSSK